MMNRKHVESVVADFKVILQNMSGKNEKIT